MNILKNMKFLLLVLFGLNQSVIASTVVHFDKDKVGSIAEGWISGVTGHGKSRWAVETDQIAHSKQKILKQSAKGDFPWAVIPKTSLSDGYVEVKIKPISGNKDQAGGLIWRWKDGNNYYVARINALENNVSIYYIKDGRRRTIKYEDAPVALKEWNLFRVVFYGKNFDVILNGKKYISIADDHIKGVGSVGLWTKADSVTEFDDFKYESAH